MSLYGDLPQARNASSADTPTWAANKPQPVFRKQNVLAPPAALLRAGRGGGRGAATPGRGPPRTTSDVSLLPTPTSSFNIFSQAGPIQDEYDPMRPNDYEDIIREREKRKQEAQLEEERQARKREQLQEVRDRQAHQRRSRGLPALDPAMLGMEGGGPVHPYFWTPACLPDVRCGRAPARVPRNLPHASFVAPVASQGKSL